MTLPTVTRAELFDWFHGHGLDENRVRNVEITVEGVRDDPDGDRVLLKVTQYVRNDEGSPFVDRTRWNILHQVTPPARRWWQRRPEPLVTSNLEAAIEVVWVPMLRLPVRARRVVA